MNKFFLQSAAILGAISVGIGAFGAHALKNMLTESNRLDTFDTAVKYLFYHTLALLAVGILQQFSTSKYLNYAGFSFLAGILIFSGSLFLICFTGIKTFGAIAPIGGTCLIIGWICLFLAVK